MKTRHSCAQSTKERGQNKSARAKVKIDARGGKQKAEKDWKGDEEDDLTLSLLYIHPHKIPSTRKEKVSILISRYTEYSRLGYEKNSSSLKKGRIVSPLGINTTLSN